MQPQPTSLYPFQGRRCRKPYLSPPSCLCLLSRHSNSSEASTIPLSVWLSCGERTSQGCKPR